MKPEYMVQIGLEHNGGIELVTSKEVAEALQAKWRAWFSDEENVDPSAIIEVSGLTRAGGHTHTVVRVASIIHISIIEMSEAKVTPIDRQLRPS